MKKEIKELIKDIELYIKGLQNDLEKIRTTEGLYTTYCEMEGEIFARTQILEQLKQIVKEG